MSETEEKVVNSVESGQLSIEEEVNRLRKAYRKADIIWKTASICMLVITVLYIICVFKKVFDVEGYLNAILAIVMLLGIFVCVYLLPYFLGMNSKMKAYSTKYKEVFIKPILEEAFSKSEYNDYDKISTRDLTKISMLKKAKSAVANDCIRGRYKDIKFLRYDLALRYGKKKSSSDCVLIIAEVDTGLKEELQIIDKEFKIGGVVYDQPENYCKLLSSNEAFDKQYNIYAKEQKEGQKFLGSSIVGKIAKFKAGGPIAVFFDKDEIYFIVKKNKDVMEAPVYKEAKKSKAAREAENEVKVIREWIEILDDCI